MNRLLIASLGLTLSTPAFAFSFLSHVWSQADLPLNYVIYEAPDGYGGIDAEDLYAAQEAGYMAWTEGDECALFEAAVPAILPLPTDIDPAEPSTGENYPYKEDSVNAIGFDDLREDLVEPGVLAAARTITGTSSADIIEIGELVKFRAVDGDIIFNDGLTFVTDEDIANGNCNGDFSVQAIATHEIGHIIGLDHSCDEGEICDDPVLQNATMFWSVPPCDAGPSTPNEDDLAGLAQLYSFDQVESGGFRCVPTLTGSDSVYGIAPVDVTCEAIAADGFTINNITWVWGDGETSEGLTGTHSYEEQGSFNVRACYEGEFGECGAWERCQTRESYVRVCDVAEAEFTYEPIDGLTYQLLNDTRLDVNGCITQIQWDVYAGTETTGEPIQTLTTWEPQVEFEEPGTYTVVLNVGGPAGTGAAKLQMDVKRNAGGGCSQSGTAPLGFLALGFGLLGLRRRS